jgi:prolyl-tRNA synthetase
VGVDHLRIIADESLRGRLDMSTGANHDDWHYRGVSVERDIAVGEWADLREVSAGEACIQCGTPIEIVRCIEAGHIFKLGRKYADAMGVSVLDENGKAVVPTMGSYGIGIGRGMAAAAEVHHDDKGLIWPVSIAPYEVTITVMRPDDEDSMRVAERAYTELRARGIDVLLDDRKARPGVKFADAELIGVPFRITIGPRGLETGEVEWTPRSTGETSSVSVEAVVQMAFETVIAAR